ncbi:MAG: response regulator [Armatimonadota bacterium]
MPRVLVIDDDPQMRQVVVLTLRERGFCCDEAENGRVGLEKLCEATFRKKPYDCVLVDIVMPEVDGWQFLQAVKSNPLWARMRIVVLSGRAISSKDIARATSLDCLHVEKKGRFLESIGQMLVRMVAPAQ